MGILLDDLRIVGILSPNVGNNELQVQALNLDLSSMTTPFAPLRSYTQLL